MEELIQNYDKLNNMTAPIAGNIQLLGFLIIACVILFMCFVFTVEDYDLKKRKKTILILIELSLAFGCIFVIKKQRTDEFEKNYNIVKEAEENFVDENYELYRDTFSKINNNEILINKEQKNKLEDIDKVFEQYGKSFKQSSTFAHELIEKEEKEDGFGVLMILAFFIVLIRSLSNHIEKSKAESN